ncbi:hypothetical protein [Aquimarina rhabdastrellae]
MKGKIFMYLFVFALLYILFQFMNAKKASEVYDKKITSLEEKVETHKKEIDSLISANLDLTYFSLDSNEDAAAYFEDQGYEAIKLANTISDQILSYNKAGEDNAIVPFVGMEGKMHINKVRLLNHKWIIADFTDGTYWGELFIVYDVKKDGTVDFEVVKSFLYPKN